MSNSCIGIIGAMKEEVDDIIANLTNVSTKSVCNINFYSGTIHNKNVVVAKSGIGKTNASMCATAMLLNFNPSEIIYTGIAGAIDNELKIRDVAIADKVCHHDFDTTAFGLKLGEIEGLNTIYFNCDKKIVDSLATCAKSLNIHYKIGTITTGDQFINDSEKKIFLTKTFGAIACEMEGAAIGQVCFINKIPFAVVRAFSDKGSSDFNTSSYYDAKPDAADMATKLVIEYLKSH